VRKVYSEKLKKLREGAKGGAPAPVAAPTTPTTPGPPPRASSGPLLNVSQTQNRLNGRADVGPSSPALARAHAPAAGTAHPIILISSSPTALITMHNVRGFLQDAVFELSADARARAGNARAEGMVPIRRRRTAFDAAGRETQSAATYYVIDSVEELAKFGQDAWERVVCVMTTGQAWQFRPYKWNEPRALFHHGACCPRCGCVG
jgi:hypothetical protein